ncbi:MAG: hypothetical protein JWN70_281 [Planctomycetaceae bacterium]|nr:hypothetical protein [Planctomycetaceae bacterium]
MRKFVLKFAVLALAVLIASPVWAAKEDKKKEKGGKAVAKAFELPSIIVLSAEQMTKLAEVKKEFEPKLEELNKKQAGILTDAQKTARKDAAKAAKAAGKTGKEAQAEVAAAIKLTDDQKKQQEEVGKELKELNGKIRNQISSFLTEEQKTHLVAKKKKKDA